MAYVPVPKDLTKIKTKIAFNLTQRQLVFIGSAGILGVPIYFLAKNYLITDLATLSMIFVMLPFFAFALYEKDGLTLEKEKSKQENEQIIKLVRGADTVSLEKLAEFLEQVKKNGGASLSQSKESEAYDEKNNDTNANSKHFNDGK